MSPSTMEKNPLSKASHELFTPLNHILGCSQLLLLNEALERENREFIEIIHKASLELNTKIQEHLVEN